MLRNMNFFACIVLCGCAATSNSGSSESNGIDITVTGTTLTVQGTTTRDAKQSIDAFVSSVASCISSDGQIIISPSGVGALAFGPAKEDFAIKRLVVWPDWRSAQTFTIHNNVSWATYASDVWVHSIRNTTSVLIKTTPPFESILLDRPVLTARVSTNRKLVVVTADGHVMMGQISPQLDSVERLNKVDVATTLLLLDGEYIVCNSRDNFLLSVSLCDGSIVDRTPGSLVWDWPINNNIWIRSNDCMHLMTVDRDGKFGFPGKETSPINGRLVSPESWRQREPAKLRSFVMPPLLIVPDVEMREAEYREAGMLSAATSYNAHLLY